MISAIHKKTNKLVNAMKVEKDSSWFGTTNDEWICPTWEVMNSIELKLKDIKFVEVSFVKRHKVKIESGEIDRRAHFRKKTTEAILREEGGMSEEHKLCEEKVYNLLWDKEIKFVLGKDIKTIFDLNIDGIYIEERFRTDKNTKIADVLIKFNEPNKYLGKGICLEIQFSTQSKEVIEYRTWKRLEEGYNTLWLFRDDFDEEFNLKNKLIKVVPISELEEEYKKEIDKDMNARLNHYSRLLDNKIESFKEEINRQKDNIKYDIAVYDRLISEKNKKIKEEITEFETKLISNSKAMMVSALAKLNIEIEKKIIDSYEISINEIREKIYFKVVEEVNKKLNNNEEIFGRCRNIMTNFVDKITLEKSKDYEDIKENFFKQVKDKIDSMQVETIKEVEERINKNIEKIKEQIDKGIEYDKIMDSVFNGNFKEFVRQYCNIRLYDIGQQLKFEVKNGS